MSLVITKTVTAASSQQPASAAGKGLEGTSFSQMTELPSVVQIRMSLALGATVLVNFPTYYSFLHSPPTSRRIKNIIHSCVRWYIKKKKKEMKIS